jgi:hypothetical protein
MRDINHTRLLSEVCDALGDDVVLKQGVKESVEASEKAGRAFVRRLARQVRGRVPTRLARP